MRIIDTMHKVLYNYVTVFTFQPSHHKINIILKSPESKGSRHPLTDPTTSKRRRQVEREREVLVLMHVIINMPCNNIIH